VNEKKVKRQGKWSGPKSHQKGSTYERDICRRLSLWVSNRLRQDVFWRTAMSGGRATMRSRLAPNASPFTAQAGDISAIHPWGHLLLDLFTVECKYWRDLHLEHLIFDQAGYIGKLWIEPNKTAALHKREPFVVLKQNQRLDIVATTLRGWRILHVGATQTDSMPRIVYFIKYGMHVFLLKDVLSDIDFNLIRTHHGQVPIHGRLTPHDASA